MAAAALDALELLQHSDRHRPGPLTVVYGDQVLLKRLAIARLREMVVGSEEGAFSFFTFDGSAAWRDVHDELSTVSLFGGGQRLVLVESADDFVSQNRAALERYIEHPRATGILLLEVSSWPSNTRLFKAVAQRGLHVHCTAPSAGQLPKWLGQWARQQHAARLEPAAAEMLVELIGAELSLLDQELAKLAAYAGSEAISAEMVANLVGGWRTRTAWDMLDAALEGRVPDAIEQLDRLLLSGEKEIAILGQIAASLRRLAAATRLVQEDERLGRRPALRQALTSAGVKPFVVAKTEQQLRRLGRQRAVQLYRWLLEADLAMKGASQLAPRLVLERLLVRLSAAPPRGVAASATAAPGARASATPDRAVSGAARTSGTRASGTRPRAR